MQDKAKASRRRAGPSEHRAGANHPMPSHPQLNMQETVREPLPFGILLVCSLQKRKAERNRPFVVICLFILFLFLNTGFLRVALAILELTL